MGISYIRQKNLCYRELQTSQSKITLILPSGIWALGMVVCSMVLVNADETDKLDTSKIPVVVDVSKTAFITEDVTPGVAVSMAIGDVIDVVAMATDDGVCDTASTTLDWEVGDKNEGDNPVDNVSMATEDGVTVGILSTVIDGNVSVVDITSSSITLEGDIKESKIL